MQSKEEMGKRDEALGIKSFWIYNMFLYYIVIKVLDYGLV